MRSFNLDNFRKAVPPKKDKYKLLAQRTIVNGLIINELLFCPDCKRVYENTVYRYCYAKGKTYTKVSQHFYSDFPSLHLDRIACKRCNLDKQSKLQ